MYIDLNELDDDAKLEADICIVGAGPAGITVAKKLLGRGVRVILLESGGFEFDEATQDLYAGPVTTGLPEPPIDASRLRYFGGASNHWAGSCSPLSPMDFRERPWIPKSGWPITLEDLDLFYAEAQVLMRMGPYDYEPTHWRSETTAFWSFDGGDVNHKVWRTARPAYHVAPFNFGQEFRKDFKGESNVTVILNANLTEIATDVEAGKVEFLAARSLKGKSTNVRAKSYVLACSGIENARLMLASNTSAGYSVGNQYDNVGRYYMIHPAIDCGQLFFADSKAVSLESANYWFAQSENGLFRYAFTLSDELQESEESPNHAVLMHLPNRLPDSGYSSLRRIYHKITGKQPLDGIDSDIINVVSDLDDVWLGLWNETEVQSADMELRCEQVPNPNSRVLLDEERDALGMPRTRVDWHLLGDELVSIREFCDLMARQLAANGIGRVKLVENLDDEEVVRELLADRAGGNHHMGTTRMSSSPRDGVVDANCRVHGMSNLYCAGSSVFPTGGFATPTFTIVALAIRLAEHLEDGR